MRFIISRVSKSEEIPCEEAEKTLLTFFLDCTCKTIPEAVKDDWVRLGIPEQKKGFVRVYEKVKSETFTIEIASLQDLLNLHKKYGALVLSSSNFKEVPLEIEIYDDYRE